MKTPLTRLLRLRALVEESSRMELERRMAVASAIAQARERERGNAGASRAQAAEAIRRSSTETSIDRLDDLARQREVEWRSASLSAGREQQIITLAQAAERRTAEEREVFMERRKERRQIEQVLESAAERERVERERREQLGLDDWFGMNKTRRPKDQ